MIRSTLMTATALCFLLGAANASACGEDKDGDSDESVRTELAGTELCGEDKDGDSDES